MAASVVAPAKAGRREWLGLAVLALPTLLLALDFSVLFLALPFIGSDLRASNTQLLWITDVYGFMVAGWLVTMGTLGDRIGRRKLLMIGAVLFGVMSVVAAYSSSPVTLIVSRALLGIAGATVTPSTLALISNMFRNPSQRTTAISLWATCLLAGVAIGPIVGGLLLESFWWGSVFLMGVPVMVVLLIAAPLLLPEYRNPDAGRIDLLSVVLSLGAILPIVYGLKQLAAGGMTARSGVTAVLFGLLVGIMFVRRQRRLIDPLLDLRLFATRGFSVALLLELVGAILVGGVGFFFAQYLQLVLGFSPLKAGLWLVPDSIGLLIGTLLAPVLARRIRPGLAIGGGFVVMTIGFLILTHAQATSGLGIVVAGVVLVSFGIAPSFVLSTDLIVGAAPPEKAGSAASLTETSSELGLAFGVAALGSIGTAVYRTQIGHALPAGLPADAVHAARDSLAAATTAAATLPGDVGSSLLQVTREAFTNGFNAASAASAPLALLLAVVAITALRHRNTTGSQTADEADTDTDTTADTTTTTVAERLSA
jgi:DHA2 family multidrug resistance protein-like MFS transporter